MSGTPYNVAMKSPLSGDIPGTSQRLSSSHPMRRTKAGQARPAPPARCDFDGYVGNLEIGAGRFEDVAVPMLGVHAEPEDGSWSAVVMNSDGSRGVASELSIGAELDAALWVGIVLLVVGALLAVLAALAITAGTRRGHATPSAVG